MNRDLDDIDEMIGTKRAKLQSIEAISGQNELQEKQREWQARMLKYSQKKKEIELKRISEGRSSVSPDNRLVRL